jgi:amino acid transporter
MSNAMKLIVRTLLIVLLMVVGTWLNSFLNSFAETNESLSFVASISMYIIYFIIGIAIATMVGPRFTKNRKNFIYLFPIFIFIVIGITPLLYFFLPMLPFPWIGEYLDQFTLLSWTMVGMFFNLAFR